MSIKRILCRRLRLGGLTLVWSGMLGLLAGLLTPTWLSAQDKHALLVAVGKYQRHDKMGTLKYPEADARAIRDLLEREDGTGYEVTILLGPDATRTRVLQELEKIAKRGQVGGHLILGFFGHGVQYDAEAYFCPFDTNTRQVVNGDGQKQFDGNKPLLEPDPETMVPMREMLAAMALSDAGHKLLLADCCRENPNRARGGITGRAFGSDLKVSDLPGNSAAIFACSQNELAYELDHIGHGAFTKAFLEAFEKSAQPTANELSVSVFRGVQALLVDTGKKQTVNSLFTGGVIDLGIVNPKVLAPIVSSQPANPMTDAAPPTEQRPRETRVKSFKEDFQHVDIGGVPEGWRRTTNINVETDAYGKRLLAGTNKNLGVVEIPDLNQASDFEVRMSTVISKLPNRYGELAIVFVSDQKETSPGFSLLWRNNVQQFWITAANHRTSAWDKLGAIHTSKQEKRVDITSNPNQTHFELDFVIKREIHQNRDGAESRYKIYVGNETEPALVFTEPGLATVSAVRLFVSRNSYTTKEPEFGIRKVELKIPEQGNDPIGEEQPAEMENANALALVERWRNRQIPVVVTKLGPNGQQYMLLYLSLQVDTAGTWQAVLRTSSSSSAATVGQCRLVLDDQGLRLSISRFPETAANETLDILLEAPVIDSRAINFDLGGLEDISDIYISKSSDYRFHFLDLPEDYGLLSLTTSSRATSRFSDVVVDGQGTDCLLEAIHSIRSDGTLSVSLPIPEPWKSKSAVIVGQLRLSGTSKIPVEAYTINVYVNNETKPLKSVQIKPDHVGGEEHHGLESFELTLPRGSNSVRLGVTPPNPSGRTDFIPNVGYVIAERFTGPARLGISGLYLKPNQ